MNVLALIIMVIGALNWGLIGLFHFDLVAALFGSMTTFSRIVYALVGIAGIWGHRDALSAKRAAYRRILRIN